MLDAVTDWLAPGPPVAKRQGGPGGQARRAERALDTQRGVLGSGLSIGHCRRAILLRRRFWPLVVGARDDRRRRP